MIKCGHTFCKNCIEKWNEAKGNEGNCPICHEDISEISPNHVLKDLIEEYVDTFYTEEEKLSRTADIAKAQELASQNQQQASQNQEQAIQNQLSAAQDEQVAVTIRIPTAPIHFSAAPIQLPAAQNQQEAAINQERAIQNQLSAA